MKPIEVHNLSKSYGKVKALKNIAFEVNEAELFGFIGPDGAGKSTLFRILTTLLKPDEGEASVLGLDVVRDYIKIRPLLGYMPGRFSLYHDLSVEENLEFFASVFGTSIDANYELVKPIYSQLEPFRDRLAGDLSGGMKQKLALSCALIHKPKVLVLDEPTTGVDAVSRTEFWDMLDRIKAEGITIVVSTPYMDEAARCDRVALIQEGEILQIDEPGAVVERLEKKVWSIRGEKKYKLLQQLRSYPRIDSVHPFGDAIHITTANNELDQTALVKLIADDGLGEVEIEQITPSIEDVFMALMETKEDHPHE